MIGLAVHLLLFDYLLEPLRRVVWLEFYRVFNKYAERHFCWWISNVYAFISADFHLCIFSSLTLLKRMDIRQEYWDRLLEPTNSFQFKFINVIVITILVLIPRESWLLLLERPFGDSTDNKFIVVACWVYKIQYITLFKLIIVRIEMINTVKPRPTVTLSYSSVPHFYSSMSDGKSFPYLPIRNKT